MKVVIICWICFKKEINSMKTKNIMEIRSNKKKMMELMPTTKQMDRIKTNNKVSEAGKKF